MSYLRQIDERCILNIIHKDCDPKVENTKLLPRNSLIVTYTNKEKVCIDIVQSNSQIEVFDFYWDEYRNVKSISWTVGLVNPKSYGYTPKELKKKK
jgi:hypothetical protein